ncbi:MAG: methionyl-tRNA formyltransferase [Syntrophomonadaceae bacterium]|nr:methionyl-tRNA formyltransferase [Syntrophomonadaceae bacterium]
MKTAFCTCVQLGLSCMQEIYAAGGKLDLVITLRDELAPEKSGRIYVDDFCQTKDIPVIKIKSINEPEVIQMLKDMAIDWLFIIGWSQIAQKEVLEAPRLGALGMHPTLLPTGRGRAAIPWAIIKGLDETGVTLFKLDEGVDTGPIIAQHHIVISNDETATTLYDKVNEAHIKLIRAAWSDLLNGTVILVPQDDSRASIWPGRTPDDGLILPTMTVEETDRLVRATTHPYPGAFWQANGKILRIWSGSIGQGTVSNKKTESLKLANGFYEAIDYQWEESEQS